MVAPPASGRPAGSKTEAEAERELFRHRQAPVCQLGDQSPGVSGMLNRQAPSKLSFLDSTVGFFVCLREAGPQAPDGWVLEQNWRARGTIH